METLAARAHQKRLELVCDILPDVPDALIAALLNPAAQTSTGRSPPRPTSRHGSVP